MSPPQQSSNEEFRHEVRQWMRKHVPEGWRRAMTSVSSSEFAAFQKSWFAQVVAAGYANAHWSATWPGGGRSLTQQAIIFEEMARADAPRLILHFVSLYHTAITIEVWGTPDQKAKHVPPILNGMVWCQGFSEPNAGSDLASLSTRAVRSDDHYIVNGQKIWSTLGQYADWCLLLVRTSTDGPKQAGITYLMLDLKSEGVQVRPIRQISGDEEFSEIFLTDVKIPVAERLGDENQGWQVAQTTLSSERGLTILELSERMNSSLWRLRDALGDRLENDAQFRRELVDIHVKLQALRALVAESMKQGAHGSADLGASSIIKLFYAEVLREFTQLGLRALDGAGQLLTPFTLGAGHETGNWMFDFLNSYIWTISGGSNEIQRNIISERVMLLPKSPRIAQ